MPYAVWVSETDIERAAPEGWAAMISLSPQVVHEMCMDGWDTPPPRVTATPPPQSGGAENAPSSPPTATGDQQELAFVALRAQLREANQEKTRAVAFARDAAVAAERRAAAAELALTLQSRAFEAMQGRMSRKSEVIRLRHSRAAAA